MAPLYSTRIGNSSTAAESAPGFRETMTIKNTAKRLEINRILVEKLRNANEIFRPAHPKSSRDNMFRAQNARPDGLLRFTEADIDVFSASQCFLVESVCDGKKLNRPTRDHDSLPAMFAVALGGQIRIDRG